MVNFIPQEKITEIQHAVDIVQIISEYVQLKGSGKNYTGLCPFHSEKTPSFIVNPEKKIFKCFGCGEGGTVFHFIMKHEGVGFWDAVRVAASKSHIEISQAYTKNASSSSSASKKANLYEINKLAANFYHNVLRERSEGKIARDYLSERSINESSIVNFFLGYAPDSWNSLMKICRERNVPYKLLEEAGLVVPRKDGNGYYDRFRNKLMFPIFDARQQIVGFGGRVLDDSLPKYINSPETVLFNKGNTLYGINVAKNAIMKEQKVILMEGYTDVIMAHQYGIEWAVAVLGTAISKHHLRLLRQYCNQIILLLDSDAAGQRSAERNLEIFIEEEFDVKIARLPRGYDPCDFLLTKGAESFLSCINDTKDFFHFKIEMASTKWDISTIQGKTNAINEILSTAMKVPNPIKRNLFIKLIAEEMSVDEKSIRAYMKKNKRSASEKNHKSVAEQKRQDASSMAERELLFLMLSCNHLIPRVMEEVGLEEFHNKGYSEIAKKVIELFRKNRAVREEDVLHMLENEQHTKLLLDISTTKEYQGITDFDCRFEECLRYIKKRNKKIEISQTKKRMLETVNNGNSEEDIVSLLKEFHIKNRSIHTLKKRS